MFNLTDGRSLEPKRYPEVTTDDGKTPTFLTTWDGHDATMI